MGCILARNECKDARLSSKCSIWVSETETLMEHLISEESDFAKRIAYLPFSVRRLLLLNDAMAWKKNPTKDHYYEPSPHCKRKPNL